MLCFICTENKEEDKNMADNLHEIYLTDKEIKTTVKALFQTMKDLNVLLENSFVSASQIHDTKDIIHNVYDKLVNVLEDE